VCILTEVTVADDRLDEVGTGVDAWDSQAARELLACVESLPLHEREACVLRRTSGAVMSLVIRLAVGQTPGHDLSEDSQWAASVALSRR
jgi:hypothetical protein